MLKRFSSLIAVLAVCALGVQACGDSGPSPTSPSSGSSPAMASPASNPSPTAAVNPSGPTAAAGHNQRTITMQDACDPETFNAQLGAGTCVRNGGVRFDDFIAQLTRHHSIGAWHFTPGQAQMNVGDELVARNIGGETHTFTEVEEFGGGIVPLLNQLSGNTTVAPECNQLQPGDFIAAGGMSRETEEDSGVEKYQCCIHPWMRTVVTIGKH